MVDCTPRVGTGSGRLLEVEQSLAGEFRDAGVGMAQKKKEKAEPSEFVVFDADEGGAGHAGGLELLFDGQAEFWNRMRNGGVLPIRKIVGESRKDSHGGAVMEIPGVERSVQPVMAPVETVPADQAAENREVVRAVKALNGTEMFGEENELTFQRDPNTQRMVVRIVNRNTKEVVSQIPPEYVLRLAADEKSAK